MSYATVSNVTEVTLDNCGATIIDWAAIVTAIITVNVTWWAMDIPLIWKCGFKVYMFQIMWQCLRLCMPSVAALYAFAHSPQRSHWARIYYHGLHNPDRLESMTTFQYIKVLITDALSIASTCMSIYKLCTSQTMDNLELSGINGSLYTYPSLPVAVIGLWILVASRTNLSVPLVILGGFLVIAAIGAAVALVIYYCAKIPETKIYIPATIFYIFIALPLALVLKLVPLLMGAVILARVSGVAIGALSKDAYFPFCALKSVAFGATYLTMGIVAALLGMIGLLCFLPKENTANNSESPRIPTPPPPPYA